MTMPPGTPGPSAPQQYPPPGPYGPPPQPQKKRRTWLIVLLVILALMLLGIVGLPWRDCFSQLPPGFKLRDSGGRRSE